MATGQLKPFPALTSLSSSRIFIPSSENCQKFLEIYYNATVFKSRADATVTAMVVIPATDIFLSSHPNSRLFLELLLGGMGSVWRTVSFSFLPLPPAPTS